MIKEDFLTIPDAPDYEINSELVVRNKATGHVLKPIIKNGNAYYRLTLGGVKFRTAKTFRRQAAEAVTNSTFEPIPSTGNHYEINVTGIIRNALTKKKLKPYNKSVRFFVGHNQCIYASINSLLWEVFGRIPKKKTKISCTVENAHGKHFFPHMVAAAKFLAPKIYLTVGTLKNYFYQRRTEIYGWKITYFDKPTDF